eukprot:CAMPEP_0113275572 /NCGR_PEP_ID=MMETSP0008_2-20120614/25019_1 /TAXON_ID=97485 /ORGANISM="Prymnesium parvum" /LENGTH=148 /DNA_ID=CAMNT_0000125291 /DNA_START=135 /DNA_END=581 /DNA_ORIENTATION=- /assembly_acc=CAM_ASM_000153
MARRRIRWLEMTPFAVPPALVAFLLNYISLAEALDQDSYALTTEDALEVAVETNSYDRVAAYVVIVCDILLVLMLFLIAETSFNLGRMHRGMYDPTIPWILNFFRKPRPDSANEDPELDDGLSFYPTTLSTDEYQSVRGRHLTARDLL